MRIFRVKFSSEIHVLVSLQKNSQMCIKKFLEYVCVLCSKSSSTEEEMIFHMLEVYIEHALLMLSYLYYGLCL